LLQIGGWAGLSEQAVDRVSTEAVIVSNSQMIGCEVRLRNDLYCVGWGVTLCSIQSNFVISQFPVLFSSDHCTNWAQEYAYDSQDMVDGTPCIHSGLGCCQMGGRNDNRTIKRLLQNPLLRGQLVTQVYEKMAIKRKNIYLVCNILETHIHHKSTNPFTNIAK